MSDYIEVIAIVEGKTEQIFIERVLRPYLAERNIFISATQVTKPGQKGGDVRFSRVSQDIGNHLKQRTDTYITTFVDYYGTKEWPGLGDLCTNYTPAQIANHLNKMTKESINKSFSGQRSEQRFIPFVVIHEFEALLFSDSGILAAELGINNEQVEDVIIECGEPEAINNSPQTAPSKRLDHWSSSGKFAKTTMGITVAERIGINKIRQKCSIFNDWIESLETALVNKA